ncbi:MAG TPA: hypothetical protein VNJ52_05715 [Patescibacteria group bacterium]|nr:hypothetical protein [Patescibacteria group bacterium]
MQPAMPGLIGDLLTVIGSILLAFDAITKEHEFDQIARATKLLNASKLCKIRFKDEGVELTDENDVRRALIRRSARKAKWGCILLAIGFILLAFSRALGLFPVSH